MLLVDADRIVYSCGWAMDDGDSPKYYMIDNLVNALFETYKDAMYRMFLTSQDKSNFRFKIAKTREYKGNRKDKRKPKWMKEVRDYLLGKYGAEEIFGMEADDIICMELYKRFKQKDLTSTIAISDDKDLKQCPGRHGDFKGNITLVDDEMGKLELLQKGSKAYPKKVLKGTGLKFFYAQVIMGDSCDDYPGAPKMGSVAAFNMLNPYSTEIDLYNQTLAAYKGNEELLDEQAGLAWMLKEKDVFWVDHKRKLLNKEKSTNAV